MIQWLTNRDIRSCIKMIQEMMIKNGTALNDVITDIHEQIALVDFPNKIKANLLIVSSVKIVNNNL